ncbi:hypothetical protein CC99x_004500 [Candidatus Berkiella cookevillensis]|uniref:Uncharacterized protein n=1 Tax=Candidatus Berkiella cookevillensis TaxID=437022 RepID=A0A0Q9YCU5_9GAMM|nr:hypothetical protein [Candidatus Berkiella cookevillensis]MCS5708158.1 hypothetical protein [Candidatus Berkiella cookevillensis]
MSKVVRILLISLISCFVFRAVLADEMVWEVKKQLHPHMVAFHFQLWRKASSQEKDLTTDGFLKIVTAEGTTVQQLSHISPHLKKDALVFLDYNFDGILEILLKDESAIKRDQYWYYNNQSAEFVEHKAVAALKNPIFDAQKKQVISQWQDREIKTNDYYQFLDNDLLLVKQTMIDCHQNGSCENIVMINKNGILTEVERNTFRGNLKTAQYLEHFIDRKGLCLEHIKEYALQGDKLLGLKEANLCLNSLVYELVPDFVDQNDRSLSLQLKNIFEQHLSLVRMITLCDAEEACEHLRETSALNANIKFVNGLIEHMVLNLGAKQKHFDKDKWVAKWGGLNEIMQG